MSGSSLDGLDACLAQFEKIGDMWAYHILESTTFPFPKDLASKLKNSPTLDAQSLLALDVTYGLWIAKNISSLVEHADLISVHGHTVFHSPADRVSLQIGSAEVIHLQSGKPVVSQFRNTDILLGGQGAPLVPMGEKLLFPSFDAFLNLGGICNATFRKENRWLAGDIGPFNQVFNHYASMLGHALDADGEIARSGQLIPELIQSWADNPYFRQPFPKSLANQWVSSHFLDIKKFRPSDILHSFAHFITDQLSAVISGNNPERLMITGGGAYNSFAMELLHQKCKTEINIPDSRLIDCKEALIFGLLGLLRWRHEVNVLSSCTGAHRDSSSGVIYQ